MTTANSRLLCSVIFAVLLTGNSPAVGQPSEETHNKHQQWLKLMSADERAKFEAAKKEAMKDPDVKAANERRKQADAEYRRLLHNQLLKADPSLKPLLDKIAQFKKTQ